MSEALLSDSDWEIVDPQSFSFSRKRQTVCVENQEGMTSEGTSKSTASIQKKDMPPTATAELAVVD